MLSLLHDNSLNPNTGAAGTGHFRALEGMERRRQDQGAYA